MKTPEPPTQLYRKKHTRLESMKGGWGERKRHDTLDGPRKGGSGEGRVWGEGVRGKPEKGGGPGQGGPGKGRSREEDQGRGPQTHGPNWPKGAGFEGLGFGCLWFGKITKLKKRFRFPFREVGNNRQG